jgi:hypothetical protein
MINESTVFFCTSRESTIDRFLETVDDDDLTNLLLDSLRLYAHASRRLRTELGRIAVAAALYEIARGEDLACANAARMILAFTAEDDVCADIVLRELGFEELQQIGHVANVLGRAQELVAAVPAVWRSLLPETANAAGYELMQRFAIELKEGK